MKPTAMRAPALLRSVVETALGPLTVISTGSGICAVAVAGDPPLVAAWRAQGRPIIGGVDAIIERAGDQLRGYADGTLQQFDLPLDLPPLPPFLSTVLACCARIPWGATTTYGSLAAAAGRPGAARAVGQAMARNPIPIVIPCHRVLAAGGIGGYTPGLTWKRRLLSLEQISLTGVN